MRRNLFSTVVLLALVVMAPAAASDSVSSGTAARLCEFVKARKTMHVDKTGPETIWSDGAIFEVARTFPRELQELIAAPTVTRDLQLFLTRMTGKTEQGWQDASGPRSSRQDHAAVESADGKIKVRVASPYFNYLKERYPRAQLRIQSAYSPILFVIDGAVRAAVMPVAPVNTEAKK